MFPHKNRVGKQTTKTMITKAIVFDHRGRTKMGQEGPVELRVTVNRKPYYISTGIKVRGRELVDGIIINRSDAPTLNEQLQIITEKMMRAVNRCIKDNIPIDVAEIRRRAYLIEAETASESTAMLDWFAEQVPLLKMSAGTRRRYSLLLTRLREHGRLRSWRDLTLENIYNFDAWLRTTLTARLSNGDIQAGKQAEPVTDGTIYNYHKSLRALINRAMKIGIIEANPYDRIKGEIARGDRETIDYLTEEEIAALESLHPMAGTQPAMARDLFIFQLYTGLPYADTQAFDISDYKKVDGRWLNTGTRIKTGVPYVSQLLPQAVEVLERYGMQPPKINNAQYNLSLKDIQKALGIKTRLHSHLARHTFATRMLRLGVKIENVSRMLGHTNITQTQRYAKVLAQSVHDDFDMVAEKLGKK